MSFVRKNLVDIVVPEAPVRAGLAASAGRARRHGTSGGLRIGVLDNSKANADCLLEILADGLRSELSVASIRSLRKENPSFPATEEVIDQLAKEADFAITAMAD